MSFRSTERQTPKTAYIGYWLDSKAQGKGFITQAVQALTHYYAEKKFIKRFVIKCSVANLKSNQVAQRCGFDYEGTLKQAEYLNGNYYDQNIYSLISSYI
ncbi:MULTISPECIES: GNAT family N-acetyltransferase [unclassified Gilliamella]|uniref:GNAT family N-acetyltransferase n=1 Tax=unclassified Gilliamella TaxID=2685620 RepID=UPI00226A2901|nr:MULTISPECIES: GNAT family N-acetyltransferase [unclassified Gilliamella]MCX8596655.1 GNAT family N-acetyltransferase [Gilliamella sp. B3493]MCX8600034.1 GNAT family N-acetyltransferase [Gilliamella sp. B3486]MCX8690261.1 GNAT family N-acetyltransferase [Gilliamella sp. B2973]MCX8705975.1 GNAT family N-acetyltransferase [Gilliamella sp. B3127]